jgi:hypothetical protein
LRSAPAGGEDEGGSGSRLRGHGRDVEEHSRDGGGTRQAEVEDARETDGIFVELIHVRLVDIDIAAKGFARRGTAVKATCWDEFVL